jgi:hypothetical protein
MSQSFYGAQPKVVKNKTKFNSPSGGLASMDVGVEGLINPEEADGVPLNIMYDKRVFRGNTYNMNLMK